MNVDTSVFSDDDVKQDLERMNKGFLVWILMMTVPSIKCRGPHHPRGASIAKHHVHYRPTKSTRSTPEKLTQDAQLLHDKEHIQEDIGDMLQEKDISTMTDQELEFYYFQLHDFDHNNYLDGLEILQAIRHTTSHDENQTEQMETAEEFDYYVELIDRVLEEDDTNSDGYLSYPEYVAGKRREVQLENNNNKAILAAPKVVSV